MDWPWCGLSVAVLLPQPLRDYAYDLVAKYRYKVML
jgi:predicted DCC family thiol-disulfide oxidoreductase YuxK